MSIPTLTYNLDALDITDIRSLVWAAMKTKWRRRGTTASTYRAHFYDISRSVAELAIQKGTIKDPTIGHVQYTTNVSNNASAKISSVLWSLISQEILMIDMSETRGCVFDITEYGLQVLAADNPIPHDPDGYLSYLKNEIPNIDDIIFTYISESINAYNHRLYLSATTAIGCASEKAFLLLLDAYILFLPSQKERDSFNNQKNRQIKKQLEAFQKSFGGQKGSIDKELTDGIDIVFSGIFELLRQNRNSTGHPTGKSMSRDRVFASLQLFVSYCKRIYELIDYFKKNAVIIP